MMIRMVYADDTRGPSNREITVRWAHVAHGCLVYVRPESPAETVHIPLTALLVFTIIDEHEGG